MLLLFCATPSNLGILVGAYGPSLPLTSKMHACYTDRGVRIFFLLANQVLVTQTRTRFRRTFLAMVVTKGRHRHFQLYSLYSNPLKYASDVYYPGKVPPLPLSAHVSKNNTC